MRRFFDFSGAWALSCVRLPGHARKGFFFWPNNFDFLLILEMRLVLENKAKVRWSLVIVGKFAAKCRVRSEEKRRKADTGEAPPVARFKPGENRKIAVKVSGDRGNELLVVKGLDWARRKRRG